MDNKVWNIIYLFIGGVISIVVDLLLKVYGQTILDSLGLIADLAIRSIKFFLGGLIARSWLLFLRFLQKVKSKRFLKKLKTMSNEELEESLKKLLD